MRRTARFVLAAALAAVALAAVAAGSRVPAPRYTVDSSTRCVAPPEVMRRTHMDMLKHRRDRTVHQGVRGGDEALTRCLECHASKTTGAAIGAPDAFCQSCHQYVGVRLDCFDCHQGKPGAAGKVASQVP
jgi:cytochrome c553